MLYGIRQRLSRWLLATRLRLAATLSVQVDDGPKRARGWGLLSERPHERSWAEIQELYEDTLEAWRKNPLAKRAVDITADYVIGDGISISSRWKPLQRYAEAFWNDRRNLMGNRLEPMVNELTIAGDLFPVLFTNPFNGLSYIRFVTKDRIREIETAPNDWERELKYVEAPRGWSVDEDSLTPIVWYGAENPEAGVSDGVMLHYAVNRPLGTILGESDMATMVPWLLRYSRMLEDRVRLHAALRAFLWFVRVPPEKVQSKSDEYSAPPEPGSVIVHDDGEEWEVKTPNVQGADAQHDLEAVRRMIFTGSGFPPHWFGERGSNRAEAALMQAPAERHLLRRQRYFVFVLQDILYHGYRRARMVVPSLPALPQGDYSRLFAPAVPDVSREDNMELAQAAQGLTNVWRGLVLDTESKSRTMTEVLLTQLFRVMGEPQEAATIRKMVDEMMAGIDKMDVGTAKTPRTPRTAERVNGDGG